MLRCDWPFKAAPMHTQDDGRKCSSGKNVSSDAARSSGAAVQKGALAIDFKASYERHTVPSYAGKSLYRRILSINSIRLVTWQSVCPPACGLALKCRRQGSDAALANETPDDRG